jgi:hypothetical protein
MSMKARLAGLGIAVGIAVAGLAPAASAATDPGEVLMDRVNGQVFDRLGRAVDTAETQAERLTGLDLQIRF